MTTTEQGKAAGEVLAMYVTCQQARDYGPLDYVTCVCGFTSINLMLTSCPRDRRVLGEATVMVEPS